MNENENDNKNENGTDLTNEQITDIAKKKHGSKWMRELSDGTSELGEPGDNSKFIRFALASWDLPPIDISDPQQVKERIGMYFRHCAENDRKPQIVGMCNWLGITRETLGTWRKGEYRTSTHSDIIQKACAFIEEMWADYMLNGKINPASGIFLAKNWYGYKDVADVVVTPNNPYQGASEDELKQKYISDMATDGTERERGTGTEDENGNGQ